MVSQDILMVVSMAQVMVRNIHNTVLTARWVMVADLRTIISMVLIDQGLMMLECRHNSNNNNRLSRRSSKMITMVISMVMLTIRVTVPATASQACMAHHNTNTLMINTLLPQVIQLSVDAKPMVVLARPNRLKLHSQLLLLPTAATLKIHSVAHHQVSVNNTAHMVVKTQLSQLVRARRFKVVDLAPLSRINNKVVLTKVNRRSQATLNTVASVIKTIIRAMEVTARTMHLLDMAPHTAEVVGQISMAAVNTRSIAVC